jgi:hypothetical protein
MRRPRGLVPGQNCRAMPSLMTATGGVSLRSSAPNPRPRRNGIERREVAGRHGYTARHVGATCDVGATLGDERVGSACCVSQPRRDDHRGRGAHAVQRFHTRQELFEERALTRGIRVLRRRERNAERQHARARIVPNAGVLERGEGAAK